MNGLLFGIGRGIWRGVLLPAKSWPAVCVKNCMDYLRKQSIRTFRSLSNWESHGNWAQDGPRDTVIIHMTNHQPIINQFALIINQSAVIARGGTCLYRPVIDRRTPENDPKAVLFLDLQGYRLVVGVSSDNHPTNVIFRPIEAFDCKSSTFRQPFSNNRQPLQIGMDRSESIDNPSIKPANPSNFCELLAQESLSSRPAGTRTRGKV